LSASARSDGPILAAQPHVRDSPVRVFFRKNRIFLIYELCTFMLVKQIVISIRVTVARRKSLESSIFYFGLLVIVMSNTSFLSMSNNV